MGGSLTCWSTAAKAVHCVLLVHLLNQVNSVCMMNMEHSCPQNMWIGIHGLANNFSLFCKSLGNGSIKKKIILGVGNTMEVSSGAVLPYPSFCTVAVVTRCVSENHEALSSIFHQKSWGVADCNSCTLGTYLLLCPVANKAGSAGTRAGLIPPMPPALGSFGVISLGREGMQQPLLEKPFILHDQFLREPWSWCLPWDKEQQGLWQCQELTCLEEEEGQEEGGWQRCC